MINRVTLSSGVLPPGGQPKISPDSPTGEIFRYTLRSPKDASGRDIYNLNDLKALQDCVLKKQFKKVKGRRRQIVVSDEDEVPSSP